MTSSEIPPSNRNPITGIGLQRKPMNIFARSKKIMANPHLNTHRVRGTKRVIWNLALIAAGSVICSISVNLVVMGLSQRRAVFIISPEWKRISGEINEKIKRGVTIIGGRGAYTGNEMHILYTVITIQEVPRLKELVKNMDPNVFMVVSDTLEVMGTRIGNQPHW